MICLAGVGTQHHVASLASIACYGPGVTTKFKPFYVKVVGRLKVLERDPDSEVGTMARHDGGGREGQKRKWSVQVSKPGKASFCISPR